LNHRWLERKGASSGAHLISSLGTYIVIVQLVSLIWGDDTKVLRTGIDDVFRYGTVIVSHSQFASTIVCIALLIGVFVWLRATDTGLRLRALADNADELALKGYNSPRLRLLAFGVSGLLCAAAALSAAYDLGFDPQGGLNAILMGVVAVLVGGRRCFALSAAVGVAIGVVRELATWCYGASWADTVTYGALLIALVLRPVSSYVDRALGET
jgi:branched-chain amino acid transport system permease protein